MQQRTRCQAHRHAPSLLRVPSRQSQPQPATPGAETQARASK
ncbi:TPA: hypothetical protein N0F65_001337 [Lagenidium giganteum]|uniref:Uncharacterized protein n=1 Tax=Lagenidium giganteum TaxID=4803 RepID=A0AAV2Z184_9STRA|nr:TPA: hypothetical protein N0F65_001337 [Lagenidium giganteum]